MKSVKYLKVLVIMGLISSVEANEVSNISKNVVLGKAKDIKEYSKMLDYIDSYNPKEVDIFETKILASGESVDCVDIYSQPSMRNKSKEKIKLKPSPMLEKIVNEQDKMLKDKSNTQKSMDISSLNFSVGCPIGTVPMKKLTIEELRNFETLEDYNSKHPSYKKNNYSYKPKARNSRTYEPPGVDYSNHEYAIVTDDVYNMGADSSINVWNSYTEKSSEFSLSQIWVQRGSGNDLETIEAGVQVYKDLYQDYNSHFFIYFTPDNYGSGGCYNDKCHFKQISSNIYPGITLSPVSTLGGTQYEVRLQIVRDPVDGDWWIRFQNEWVGYYENSLFDANGLKNEASKVRFGGEIINNSTSTHTKTDMGSGNFSSSGFQYAAFQRHLKYLTYTGGTDIFYNNYTNGTKIVTDANCYNVDYTSYSSTWGSYFYFGGSGYNANCQ